MLVVHRWECVWFVLFVVSVCCSISCRAVQALVERGSRLCWRDVVLENRKGKENPDLRGLVKVGANSTRISGFR